MSGQPICATALTIRELPRSERPRERLVDLGAQALSCGRAARDPARVAAATGRSALADRAGGSRRRRRDRCDGSRGSRSPRSRRCPAWERLVRLRSTRRSSWAGAWRRRSGRTARRCARRATSCECFAPRLEDLPVEEFHVAVLDAQHRLERDITVTRGILNSSLVHPREVFREAIAERAAAVILVHNHPSGDPTPSADDRVVTEQLVAAGGARHSGARPRDHRTGTVHELRGGGTVVTATAVRRELIPGWREDELPLHDKLDRDLLVRAYRFSEAAHRGQMRNSGEPYITHCVEVAKILADLQLDSIDRRERAAPRRRRGHRVTLADVEARVRQGDRRDRRRADEDRQAADGRLDAGAAGRELPQAAAVDREGRARHHRQARRPPAQHADARLAAAGEAPPHRAGNARPLRAARAPLRYGEAAVGARGPRVQASRDRTTTRRSRRRSRRSAASARR